jgi:hypothetical protein
MSIVKLNNRGVRSATTFGSITGLGSMVFIKKQTASSSSTISFIHGTSDVIFDNSYKEYLFTLNNMHPSSSGQNLKFNFTTDGTNWNVTKTTTDFQAVNDTGGTYTGLSYVTGSDLAQSTDFQSITNATNASSADHCAGAFLTVFNPSSTTFVKHFIGQSVNFWDATDPSITNEYVAGYCNTTSAITGVQFKFGSGNIDAGDICLYGIN